MRRVIALAGLSVVAALFATPGTASACDPYRPPWCETPCTIARDAYYLGYYGTGGYDGPLPSWREAGGPDCGR